MDYNIAVSTPTGGGDGVNGHSDYVGMVMIMFRNTGDYQWDGNDNVPEY